MTEEPVFVDAALSPDEAMDAVNAIKSAAAAPPRIEDPTDGPVTLPGGFRRLPLDGSLETVETTAWVRELNGYDEEKVFKAKKQNSLVAYINSILECGVEKIGDTQATPLDIKRLTIGDRDALLLAISSATYGDVLEYEDVECYMCHNNMSFSFNKSEDIPVRRFKNSKELEFTVDLRRGRKAVCRLATGEDDAQIERVESPADKNTLLLSSIIEYFIEEDGSHTEMGLDPEAVRSLGILDRQSILKEHADHQPGPRFQDVVVPHPDCGNEIKVFVTLADLFRGL